MSGVKLTKNSREAELKAKRRSWLGVMERRRTAIILAEQDIAEARDQVWRIERELTEYGWQPREAKRPAGLAALRKETP